MKEDLSPLGMIKSTRFLAIQKLVSGQYVSLSDHDKYDVSQFLEAVEFVEDKLRRYPGGKYRIVSIHTEVHRAWNLE